MGPIARAQGFALLVRLWDLPVDIVLDPADFEDRDEARVLHGYGYFNTVAF